MSIFGPTNEQVQADADEALEVAHNENHDPATPDPNCPLCRPTPPDRIAGDLAAALIHLKEERDYLAEFWPELAAAMVARGQGGRVVITWANGNQSTLRAYIGAPRPASR